MEIRFDSPAVDSWESGTLPIGNGHIGANVYGGIDTETLTLNEKSLWTGGPDCNPDDPSYYWNVNKESADKLPEIRSLLEAGKTDKAYALLSEHFQGLAAYPFHGETPNRFGTYTTAGRLQIETGLNPEGVSGYSKTLSLDSALVRTSFAIDGTAYKREAFISYPSNTLAMRFSANKRGSQNLKIKYVTNPISEGSFAPDSDGKGLFWTGFLTDNGMRFAVRLRVLAKGGETFTESGSAAVTADGKTMAEGGRIIVEGADEVTLLLTMDTDYKVNFDPDFGDPKTYVGTDPEATTETWMDIASAKDFNALFAEHYADYSSLFGRVKISLGDADSVLSAANELSTASRLKNYRSGTSDTALEELFFQYGRYLLIASSRKGAMPANLQGIWTEGVNAPWNADYHNNINVQMNYWASYPTNLAECAVPLNDFIRSLEKPGERVAKSYFNARGWTASISANIFGFASPVADPTMYWNYIPVAGPWLATHLWEYYDFTRDEDFLKDIAYPLIKSSAYFTIDHLYRRPDGTLTASPSTSPEHGNADEGATFCHAVVRDLLGDAIKAAEALGVDEAERAEWAKALEDLAPYQIGRYGQLMEWSKDIDNPEDTHRHLNHLYGLHPGSSITPENTPELAEAAKVVLNHRGDRATGWSMGWKINQWARLHDGERAYLLYGNLLKFGTLDNLWSTHPPFQIDGNFGGTAGVTEMLLQSHAGMINLLPALPSAWSDGKVSGLCARGNFEVSMEWADGVLTRAVITSKSGGMCRICHKETVAVFDTEPGETFSIGYKDGEFIF